MTIANVHMQWPWSTICRPWP